MGAQHASSVRRAMQKTGTRQNPCDIQRVLWQHASHRQHINTPSGARKREPSAWPRKHRGLPTNKGMTLAGNPTTCRGPQTSLRGRPPSTGAKR
ncbi:hypothetical protein NDU88_001081 [Pleurodeles waltl]|uniref:Uncharacterized protein n=1 Tax=Pleurodeles waltl TaxID=8319 RepID=A0AAV7S9X8_PLEWA|nr:hypothetical protein NDU88_001081 [Pleurodeles waltl]